MKMPAMRGNDPMTTTRAHQTILALGTAAMLTASLLGTAANAALVTQCGPTICYQYDDAQVGVTYFGLPTLLGASDTLQFTPTTFAVDSDPATLDIPGPTVVATFVFSSIYTTTGQEIVLVKVAEQGDYQILGSGDVNANLWVRVGDQVNDNGTLGFPEQIIDSQNFNTSTPTGFAFQPWSLTSSVSPAAVFNDLATNIDLYIQNTLQAFSTDGYAYIAKKLLLTVSVAGGPTTVIPVPAAVWFFGSALGLLVTLRRKAGQA